MEIAIETTSLSKSFGDIHAVDAINLRIPKGSLFGFLGPNGAGKTTTISMLSTTLPPTKGNAKILDLDLKKDAKKIRNHIGVCPQDLVLYERLTARENIHLIAQMHGLKRSEYKEKSDDLLGRMNLLERANDKVAKYSGGMKRRVNLLMAVIHDPDILYLDEPSAGLDPQSRRVVWDFIKEFQNRNKTVILTTHNMEEADDLSDELVIIDYGRIIAQGTPNELKGRLGEGDIIEFKILDKSREKRENIIKNLEKLEFVKWAKEVGKSRIILNGRDGLRRISEIIKTVKVQMLDISIRKNTLEDVFLDLTGRRLRNND